MAGKFLNRFPIASDPPHFDRWASTTGFHYRYEANVDGEVRQSDGTYQTDFVRDKSVDFLAAFEDSDAQPWFLYAAPFAPHGPPKVPERYRDASVPPFRPTEAHRDKLRDKSRWLRDRVPEPYDARTFRRGQLRMLMAVDEMVGDIFDRLDALGETNTLAVFTSDSGILYGEHKRWGKHWPYPPVHRIPLYLRWPGVIEPGTDRRLAANIDVAPTIADAVGLDMPMVDGHSLLRRYRRRAILVERWAKPRDRRRIPAWALVQTRRHLLLRFYGRRHRVIGQEFYNLARDPHRLRNVWGDRRRGNEPRRRLERRMVRHLREARRCEGGACP
jgi:arylsulfatase A-like enzyme